MKDYIPVLILLAALVLAGAYVNYLKNQIVQLDQQSQNARQELAAMQDTLRVVERQRDSLTYAITSRLSDQAGMEATIDPSPERVEGESQNDSTQQGRSLESTVEQSTRPDSVRHTIQHTGLQYRLSGWVDVYTRHWIRYNFTVDRRPFRLQAWHVKQDGVYETRLRVPRSVSAMSLSGSVPGSSPKSSRAGVELGVVWDPNVHGVFVGYRRSAKLPFVPVDGFVSGEMQFGVSEQILRPAIRVGFRL